MGKIPTTETRSRRVTRYWLKNDAPYDGWPWDILLAAGIFVLLLYGVLFVAPEIEADVESQVRARLAGAGITNPVTRGDGQGIIVLADSGTAKSRLVESLVSSTKCDTWAGAITCPSTVNVVSVPPASRTTEIQRPHDFVFAVKEGRIRLSGDVPNEEVHAGILSRAKGEFDAVDDNLVVSNETATDAYPLAVERAFSVVSRFTHGQVTWADTALNVNGMVLGTDAKAVRKHLVSIDGSPALGQVDIQVEDNTNNCNKGFAAALGASSIRFASASARIDATSETLLQKLAQLARDCPGQLVINGHTDSVGNQQKNVALSLARANAVRNALVKLDIDGARVKTNGYGDSQPVADNLTAAGRSKNRRIVITVANRN